MSAADRGLPEPTAVFGEAKPEWSPNAATADPLRPFLFYARAVDSSRLAISASDFHSFSFDRAITAHELEDLRDDVGIGGSWSEFLDYLVASLSSEDVTLVLDGSGTMGARLTARKCKGLPRISLPLDRVNDSSDNDTVANLSLALFKELKNKQSCIAKEKEHASQLAKSLSSERERNGNLQKQLDAYSYLSQRKVPKSKEQDRALAVSDAISNLDSSLVSNTQQPSEVLSGKDPQSKKPIQRSGPANRRAKIRGAVLQDTMDGDQI